MPSHQHPIIQALTLSQQQVAAIRDLQGDALITAGAGTGKTRTLTARYLQLLVQGLPLRSIVAITFTRKAAREMRNRIRKELWAYADLPHLPEDERARWRQLAVQLDAARISTIHGLCQEILRSHPVEAQVDPDFATLEEGKSLLLRAEAVDDAFFWAASQTELADLLAAVDEAVVRRAVSRLLGIGSEARKMLADLPTSAEAVSAAWASWLHEQQQAALAEMVANPSWQEARQRLATATPLSDDDKLAIQVAQARAALFLLDDGQVAQGIPLLIGLKLTGGSARHWPGGKEEVTALKGALRHLREASKDAAWLAESLNQEDERSARALVQLRAIALRAMHIYAQRKHDLQALDFDDLEHRAIALLREHEPVRMWWQKQVQALLVDEFQDTNQRQTQLLALLDAGRGVRFLVGDGKQSIYRFRGADVAVFQDLRHEFQAAGYRLAALDETWRAHRHLVNALNTLLEPILSPARHLWEAPFEALQPARGPASVHPGPPFIEFYLGTGTKAEGALTRSAQAVVQRLRVLLDEGHYQPGDVAILCRASTSFSVYEDALDAAGIPFLTLAGRGFYQRPEIRDLVVVMRAAADPGDDVALVGALRSPGLGLSDVALYQLAQIRQQQEEPLSLWQALPLAIAAMPAPEQARAQRARTLIMRLAGMAGRDAVADLLKTYLDETDYLAILTAAGQQRAARNVSKLLADVQRARFVQIADFIDFVKLSRVVAVREGEAPVVAEGAVQLMTVHRAKGLEFPLVVLGDVTHQSRSRPGLLIAQKQVGWQLPRRPGHSERSTFYRALQQLEQQREDAEDRRLLYVAATRAQEALFISGVAQNKGWLQRLVAALAIPINFRNLPPQTEELTAETYRCILLGEDWQPQSVTRPAAATTWHPKLEVRMLAKLVADEDTLDDKQKAVEARPERRVWRIAPRPDVRARAPAWVVGSLVHRAIELERFPLDTRFDAWFKASARGLGLSDDAMLQDALARARRTLNHFVASDFWQRIKDNPSRVHEWPYDLRTDTGIDRGIIDIAWQEEGQWFLADFKTDYVKDESAMRERIRQERYDQQVRRYITAMQHLLNVTPVAYLCFLNVSGDVVLAEYGQP